jgi:protein-tyrosine phosphatase
LKFDKETIYNEYLLSNNYRKPLVEKIKAGQYLHFCIRRWICRFGKTELGGKRYLDAAFGEIEKNMVLQMPIFSRY